LEREALVTLSLWALNPALAFNDLAGPGGARAVVLTSGTLAPLSSFASELGVAFPIRMEAPHCVDMDRQVLTPNP
jgi:Fanconi anemia group J protein